MASHMEIGGLVQGRFGYYYYLGNLHCEERCIFMTNIVGERHGSKSKVVEAEQDVVIGK